MKYSKVTYFVLGAYFLIAACSGSGIGTPSQNPSEYFGCYDYDKTPLFYIDAESAYNMRDGKSTKINGFLKIRNSDFLLTQNQIIFDSNRKLQFTARNSGFQYEFKQKNLRPVLLIYGESGEKFELIRSSNACSH